MSTENPVTTEVEGTAPESPAAERAPTWTPPPKPSFNSPAADLNQLRNEARRIAEIAPSQAVHPAVLARARNLTAAIEHDLGLPEAAEGLCYADLAALLSQSK